MMSKSFDNTIQLFAPDKQIKKSIMRIVTDSTPVEAPKDPASCNVYQLLALFLDEEELSDVAGRYRSGGTGYGAFKTRLLEAFHARFDDARRKREELARDPGHVQDVLRRGAARARAVGAEVLADVQRACGLR
jgi:tryptophanyl-tRNA synthetase